MPTVGTDPIAGRGTYIGLFLVTLATLMYEILLTRIFSVTVNYHSAFFAISVAMFGLTVGALIVYLQPHRFAGEKVHGQMFAGALLFSVFMVLGFLVHLAFPFYQWWQQVITCVVLALPFTFGGIAVCLALTKFPFQVGRLYAVDLVGAALGCLLLIWVLDFTDAGTAVVIAAALAALGGVCFSAPLDSRVAQTIGLILFVVLSGFAAYNTWLVGFQESMLRLILVKGEAEVAERRPEFIKWNSFSRIQVSWHKHQPGVATPPFGWGLSPKAPHDRLVKQRAILIDASAATAMTEFGGSIDDGERSNLEFLKYDVSNLAHHLLGDAKVLVVGAGGGRDLLSALVFDQRQVIGVEINNDILKTLTHRYGRFTGHLNKHPKIKLVNDEARSYVARQPDHTFDILQVSLIDTWAATAAGAFALTENSLYTVEAWRLFLRKLTARGVLSFSRWYYQDRPGEAYRLTSLASTALLESGIRDPRQHIILVKSYVGQSPPGSKGVATILVSRTPYAATILDKLEAVAREMEFEVVVSPRQAQDEVFERLASGHDLPGFAASFPIDISAPTDDRPFFFNFLRLRDLLAPDRTTAAAMSQNLTAVEWLGRLLIVVSGLTVLCILVPLLVTFRRVPVVACTPLFLFFIGIGLGFLLVEISLMQQLILFLGHPTYGLAVVLFAMLLSGGLGAWLSQQVAANRLYRPASSIMILLLVLLYLFGTLAPHATQAFEASTTPVRILVAGGLVFLLGVPMGTAFPLGIRMAQRRSRDLTPWLWGINGATSVCASVLAIAIALTFGIAAAYWCGTAAYGLALLATLLLALMDRRRGPATG